MNLNWNLSEELSISFFSKCPQDNLGELGLQQQW